MLRMLSMHAYRGDWRRVEDGQDAIFAYGPSRLRDVTLAYVGKR